ncbi:thioesterase II family protein [Nonomuraea sp. NPDC059023]|uniref:thioesterase II family protein n=1 Tax=unclassified Nonomuraea TaxID=2593643 RepID=UPI00367D26E9
MLERWMLEHRPPNGRTRAVVYTVPAAGAGAAAHRELAGELPDRLAVFSLRLPGRESRFSEPPLRTMTEVIGAYGEKLARHARGHGLPFVLVGDCSGGLIAYELGRSLERRESGPPEAVAVIGQHAPCAGDAPSALSSLPEDRFRAALVEEGILSSEVAADDAMFAFFGPVVRADLAVAETYRWQARELPRFPIMAFTRDHLDARTEASLLAWTKATRGGVRLVARASSATQLARLLDMELDDLLAAPR